MKVYMVRQVGKDSYYRAATTDYTWYWADKENASIWTNLVGPHSVINFLASDSKDKQDRGLEPWKVEIVELEAKESEPETPERDFMELQNLSRALYNLMENPELGLMSWHDSVSNILDKIAKYHNDRT